jgi:YD repeat-containing protein
LKSVATGDGGYAQDNAGLHPAAAGSVSATPNLANQVTASNAMLTYDANGFLIGDGTRSYTHDQRGGGKVMTMTVGGRTWSYDYDPWDRRYSKTAPLGPVTLYLHDRDGNEIAEHNQAERAGAAGAPL